MVIQSRREKTMFYRIAISLAAAAIGISYITTDASAHGSGGGGGGGKVPEAVGFSGGAGGVGGAVAAHPSYAVPLYDAAPSNGRPACGYYPYPPCRRH